MNRFYQPSLPRYTSQFIDTPLPAEMMFKAGEAKYQQQQQFAQNVAEISSMTTINPPGNRTVDLAPKVNEKYENKVDEFVTKYADKYDSPQAMMELYKLHSDWSRDPQVQLIKRDREEGDKQWNEMIAKTKTYQTDIKPDVNPQTGMLYQFGPNDNYKPYSPFIGTQDWVKHWADEFKNIESSKRTMPFESIVGKDSLGNDIRRMTNTEVEYRDPKMIQAKALDITKRVMEGTDATSLYHREILRQTLGHEPTPEEVYQSILPIAQSAQISRVTGHTTESEIKGTGSGSTRDIFGGPGMTEISKRTNPLNTVTHQEIRQLPIDTFFRPGTNARDLIKQNSNMNAIYNNMLSRNPNVATMDDKQLRTEMKKYVDDESNKAINYKFDQAKNKKEQDEWNKSLSGGVNTEGEMKAEGKSEILRGATVINTRTGETLQNMKDKDNLVQKGNSFNVLGPTSFEDIGKQPLPGLVHFEAGKGHNQEPYGVQVQDLVDKQKDIWDLYGFQRETITGVSPVFAIDFDNPNKLTYHDISDAGTNSDDRNVSAGPRGLYFVSQQKPDGEIYLKVFAGNPKGTPNDKNKLTNTGIDDNSSQLFIKEYKLSDHRNNMGVVMDSVLKDVEDQSANGLLNIRKEKLQSLFNQ